MKFVLWKSVSYILRSCTVGDRGEEETLLLPDRDEDVSKLGNV